MTRIYTRMIRIICAHSNIRVGIKKGLKRPDNYNMFADFCMAALDLRLLVHTVHIRNKNRDSSNNRNRNDRSNNSTQCSANQNS